MRSLSFTNQAAYFTGIYFALADSRNELGSDVKWKIFAFCFTALLEKNCGKA
jgi:hypothetical protein